jgi:transposase
MTEAPPAFRRHAISDKTGALLERTYLDAKGAGAAWRRTIGVSSTGCSGFCAPARRGATCRRSTGDGATPIVVSSVSGTSGRAIHRFPARTRNTHRRFIRWRDKDIWEKLLEVLIDEPDHEWLMIDASHCKVHPPAAGAKGGNQDRSRTKGGSTPSSIWPWMHRVGRSEFFFHKGPQRIARRLAA